MPNLKRWNGDYGAPRRSGAIMLSNGGRRIPNLFIIGAMKSGTTSLHHYLAQHPQAFMCEPKEPGYFVEELNLGMGLDWYLDLFQNANGARIVGESSTHFAKLPTYSTLPPYSSLLTTKS